VSHSRCVCLYRWVIGLLLLGLALGAVSGSLAQQVPAPFPGVPSGSPSAPAAQPNAPGLPGSVAPTSPVSPTYGQPAPAQLQPGGPPAYGRPTPAQPQRPGAPGLAQPGPTLQTPGITGPPSAPPRAPGAVPGRPSLAPTGPTPLPPTLGEAPLPQTGQEGQPSRPPTGTAGEISTLAPATAGAQLPGFEEPSSIERLIAGSTRDPNAFLQQFGYDLFTRVPTTFAPVVDVPVGPNYVIGPGDSLNILLWGGVQEAHQIEVDRNGAIALPRLGVVQVWGLTLDQLQRLLQQRFSEFYSDFRMAVTLGKLRTILVYVVGEVRQPGAYTVSSLSTIINALFASGGPTKNGSLRHIQLLRAGRQIHTLDLYHFLIQGDKSQDQPLQSGDTILVPLIGPIAGVAGNVKRPGIYEIEPGTTMRQLLELAGDVTTLGYLQRVQVERAVANERKVVIDVDLTQARSKAATATLWRSRIVDGDLVQVFAINTAISNSVLLEGHVLRPGRYELKSGMRLRDLIPSYEALLPEPYLDYTEIVRYIGPDLRRTAIPCNLGAMLAGDPTQNLTLQPRDIIRVFARADFVDPLQVRISGLVHKPGIYPLTEGMRLSDLIFRAGNVLKFAYLERAELTRRPAGQSSEATMRIEINLGKALEGDQEHNLFLQDFDHLMVRQIPDVELQRDVTLVDEGRSATLYPLVEDDPRAVAALQRVGKFVEKNVEIRGEVRYPGLYPIFKGERLSSALQRAGGFTQNAYPRGAIFTRVRAKEEQEKRLQELIREQELTLLTQSATTTQAALNTDEVQAQRQSVEQQRLLLERLKAVQPEGRLVVRLQSLETFAGSTQDIELDAGDRLVIPTAPQYINVLGEVYNRTALIYEPQRTIGYYLEKVGGLKPDADTDQVYLIQVDGTVISNTQNQYAVVLASGQTMRFKDFFKVQPQPGDSIIVPRRIVNTATLRNVRDIVQIIFQSVSSLGVIAALVTAL
jgi:polysaccharide biosynthesis/export protein